MAAAAGEPFCYWSGWSFHYPVLVDGDLFSIDFYCHVAGRISGKVLEFLRADAVVSGGVDGGLSGYGCVIVLFLLGIGVDTGLFSLQPMGWGEADCGYVQILRLYVCRQSADVDRVDLDLLAYAGPFVC